MKVRRYAIGPRSVLECGRVHVAATRDAQGCSVLLMVTEPRGAAVIHTGCGRGATCAEAFQAARYALSAPVESGEVQAMRQLELFQVVTA